MSRASLEAGQNDVSPPRTNWHAESAANRRNPSPA